MGSKNGSIGFEDKLWKTADKLRNNMDPSQYKYVVLGLIFIKYISDSFEEVYSKLEDQKWADPEDKDEYKAKKVFWVPKKSRWDYIQNNAKQSNIGEIIDNAMDLIEEENESLRNILPKNYNRPTLDQRKLGELVDLIGSITIRKKEQDLLGRVYEYFLGKFADAEGKSGGQFYTPKSIVKTLVYMLKPYRGRVYDPCCGSGGMFVQSEEFIEEHSGRLDDIYVYGQESNPTTWKLCKMNLAIRKIDNSVKLGDTFHEDKHPDLKANYVIANPPFNDSDWGGEHLEDDPRWKYGIPPNGNANYAWVQHFIYHLSPSGVAGFVLSNGSMSSNVSNEGTIRKNIVEDNLVDSIVALPSKLFYNTQIPACLWFLRRGKKKRKDEVLFIDARDMGKDLDRSTRELTKKEILKISDTYHAWRDDETEQNDFGNYEDIAGFCKSATIKEIEKNNFVLTPGRYVGIPEKEDDFDFEERMDKLTSELSEQMEKEKELNEEIKNNLEKIGYKVIL